MEDPTPLPSPWEALDLDDSDISSSFSLLRPCSNRPPSHSLPPPPPPPQPSRAAIPGPAGAIQAAMHRKSNDNHNRLRNSQAVEISTQEYIRRVEQDSGEEFSRNPWVFALDCLRRDGLGDATPLSAIKKCVNAQRVDTVVAIVKACNPNGLGDMMVSLKDPSDTISATVHRKVLGVGDFGKFIAVGSVLVLQKMVAFSLSCASCYLNITRSNVVKVISVDCGVKNFVEANFLATPVFGKNTEIPPKTVDLISRRTEAASGHVEHSYNLKRRAAIEKQMGKANASQASSLVGSKHIENVHNKFSMDRTHIDLVDSGPTAREVGSSYRSTQPGPATAEGMARNLEHHQSLEYRQGREFSSAPCVPENLDSRYAWRENGKMDRMLRNSNNSTKSRAAELDIPVGSPSGTSSNTAENLDRVVSCGANDVQNKSQVRDFSSPSTVAENLTNQELHNIRDSQKRRQLTDTVLKSKEAKQDDDLENKEGNGVKKQRLALISRSSVQEWTDEQLNILDLDED